ncbi:MAG: hypothetical protein GY696_01450 [Gammaproteobacteria bacterium]|nr:hypothetical protein [Gammaproteobacteria bacterium]
MVQAAAGCLKVRINPIMAISAMFLMCVTGIHTDSIDYFDCCKPTLIERFWRPSVCASLPETSSEQALRKSFEVLAENTENWLAGAAR